MPSWRESVRFSEPVRNVVLVATPRHAVAELPSAGREELLRGAYQRGRADGERALGEHLVQQRAEFIELQQGVLASLREAVPQLVKQCERTIMDLAFAVAEKLVAGMPINAEMLEAAVRDALSQVEHGADLTVFLNAHDLDLLKQVNSPVLAGSIGGDRITFNASNEVTRGGCIVQSHFGTIDARRETKAALLKSSVEG